MNRQATLEQKREAEFHQRIAKLLSKRMQGYVMGAFREAMEAAEKRHAEEEQCKYN